MLVVAPLYLLGFIAAGLTVAAAIGLTAFALGTQFSHFPLLGALGEVAWSTSSEFNLLAVPLFIMMGELLTRAQIMKRMYEVLSPWVAWLPGGLMHTNIISAGLFSATSGSSVATAATVTTVSLPNLERDGYDTRLFLGTLAAGGTLGILIPPSINLILFGLIAEVSIADLYLAALIPGVFLAAMFSVTVLVICLIDPAKGGNPGKAEAPDLVATARHLLPPILLFVVVIGSIYAGLATPSESAALGIVVSVIMIAFKGKLTLSLLGDAARATMVTTAMVMLIVTAAFYLTLVMGAISLTDQALEVIRNSGLEPLELLLIIVLFYLVLGCFLDPISMMIATAPIVVPIVAEAGFNPVWFGVVFMILTEAALVTPPIGMNLFVVQSVRRQGSISDVARGTVPFFAIMLVTVALLVMLPQMALWLPGL